MHVRHFVRLLLELLDAARDLVDVRVVFGQFGQLARALHGESRMLFEEVEEVGLTWEEPRQHAHASGFEWCVRVSFECLE
jgi:hypothetical protein